MVLTIVLNLYLLNEKSLNCLGHVAVTSGDPGWEVDAAG